ncbi:hypothetical protein BOX30_09090 [Leptospirillum ferriphilum]|uniref:Uncharacterized protein n=1 Tax=Leptospirillum ferriphilum TaxID=178606 RepID=A0A1V3STX0_9BACT|nr:hypothetical protein BOX24_08545 [Leptospirillum ferriphilum]OOH77884.1 hypothetical protein BOX30_09090 [Leptospirillum ferriphilum]
MDRYAKRTLSAIFQEEYNSFWAGVNSTVSLHAAKPIIIKREVAQTTVLDKWIKSGFFTFSRLRKITILFPNGSRAPQLTVPYTSSMMIP